jgi:AraC family transcriptional regulator of adaptative response/methylated-DNA-[protein]-cysteine methyltransferase
MEAQAMETRTIEAQASGRRLEDYRRVEAAIRYLEDHATKQPELTPVARHVGLSPHHFQRLFKRWAGVSPKRFLQFLTVEHAKRLLAASETLLETSWEVGLSGPGRLHDLFVAAEAVTPGEYKARGEGLTVRWGVHPSPFGACLLAATERGICHLSFLSGEPSDAPEDELRRRFPEADLEAAPEVTAPLAARIFAGSPGEEGAPLALHLRGTNFQLQVWKALLALPRGAVVTYGGLARRLGRPGAARAVGAAVGANPVAYLIPCHRVLRGSGELGGYRWGTARKRALLGWEAARREGEG